MGGELLFVLTRAVLVPPLRTLLAWEVEGAERVPPEGPCLIASNHVSYLDPLAIGNVLDWRGRIPRFLAKEELFRSLALGWFMRSLRQIPVRRGSGEKTPLQAAVEALRRGEVVVVFPEGTISPPPHISLLPFKTGAVRIAREVGLPVLPLGIWGTQAPWSFRKGVRGRVALVFGEAEDVSKGSPAEAAARLAGAVGGLAARARELLGGRA